MDLFFDALPDAAGKGTGTAPYAVLWVEDSGIGIPEDDLSLLFQRFHRGRNASAYPGNGLGLAIVNAVMETAGGQVLAENTGHGALFTLRFPLANEAQRDEVHRD